MKNRSRLGLVIFIGLCLMAGFFSLLSVSAQNSDMISTNMIGVANDLRLHADRIIPQSPGDALEIQGYLPVLSVKFGRCMAVPTLLTPTNGAILNTLNPEFWWNNESYPNADYIRLVFSTDPQFEKLFTAFTGSKPDIGQGSFSLASNFEPGTTYFWRGYYGCFDCPNGPYTDIRSFTTGSGGTILPAPALQSPANGALLATAGVTLTWHPVTGAVAYVVAYRPVGVTWYSYQTVSNPEAQVSAYSLDPSTTYEWWVRVKNDYAYSADSPKWQFTTPAGVRSSSMPRKEAIRAFEEDGVLWVERE